MTSRNNFLPCWCTSESFDQPLTTCKHSQWNDFYWESSISSPDPDSLQEKVLPWSRSCFDQIGTLRTRLPFTGWRLDQLICFAIWSQEQLLHQKAMNLLEVSRPTISTIKWSRATFTTCKKSNIDLLSNRASETRVEYARVCIST